MVPRLGKAHGLNEQRACGFPFLWGRRGPPLHHLMQGDACMPHPSHARPTCHALDVGHGEVQLIERSWRSVSAMPAHALLWAWLNYALRLCVAQAWGLPWVYKSMDTSVPLTSARAVAATPATGLGGAEEEKTQRQPKQMLKTTSSRRLAGLRPATGLAGVACEAPGKLLAGVACEGTSRSITLEVESSDTIDKC